MTTVTSVEQRGMDWCVIRASDGHVLKRFETRPQALQWKSALDADDPTLGKSLAVVRLSRLARLVKDDMATGQAMGGTMTTSQFGGRGQAPVTISPNTRRRRQLPPGSGFTTTADANGANNPQYGVLTTRKDRDLFAESGLLPKATRRARPSHVTPPSNAQGETEADRDKKWSYESGGTGTQTVGGEVSMAIDIMAEPTPGVKQRRDQGGQLFQDSMEYVKSADPIERRRTHGRNGPPTSSDRGVDPNFTRQQPQPQLDTTGELYRSAELAAPTTMPSTLTKLWVGLQLPTALAEELAIPGGEPADKLHLTLGVFPYPGDDVWQNALNAIRRVARQRGMIHGSISGAGRFNAPDGTGVVYAVLDAPDLLELRYYVMQAMKQCGAGSALDNHGFVPHITLAYTDHADAVVPKVPTQQVVLPAITVSNGFTDKAFVLTGQYHGGVWAVEAPGDAAGHTPPWYWPVVTGPPTTFAKSGSQLDQPAQGLNQLCRAALDAGETHIEWGGMVLEVEAYCRPLVTRTDADAAAKKLEKALRRLNPDALTTETRTQNPSAATLEPPSGPPALTSHGTIAPLTPTSRPRGLGSPRPKHRVGDVPEDADAMLPADYGINVAGGVDIRVANFGKSAVMKFDDVKRYTFTCLYEATSDESKPEVDAHNEYITDDELYQARLRYVQQKSRSIFVQHGITALGMRPAGEWIDLVQWPLPVTAAFFLPGQPPVARTIPADSIWVGIVWLPWAWELIKQGKIRGLSLGGRGRRRTPD